MNCPSWPARTANCGLMTVRSEGQFNTVVYEEADIYRGQERRDVVLVHPDDLRRLAIAADSRVTVRSAAGALVGVLARAFDKIKPGNALMYYPEANVLVPREVDPRSRTPAFKNVTVRLEPVSPQMTAARNGGDGAVVAPRATAPRARRAATSRRANRGGRGRGPRRSVGLFGTP